MLSLSSIIKEMLNDRLPAILIGLIAVLFLFCPVTGVVAQNKKQNDSVLAEVQGLDHPGILVRDLEAAKDTKLRCPSSSAAPPKTVWWPSPKSQIAPVRNGWARWPLLARI